jgi:MarR family transcriptional regulator, negative regulator of the multidrug operon emrRAB
MFYLRDLPNYEMIKKRALRYPEIDPAAVEATLMLLRVAVDVLGAFDVWLARHNMSQGRFSMLMLLNRDPERAMSPSDLAARAGVTRATVTGLLDVLEREGMIQREHAEHDRRMIRVRLTCRGREYLDSILPDYYRRVADLMGDLSEEEERTLTDMLRRVRQGVPAITA